MIALAPSPIEIVCLLRFPLHSQFNSRDTDLSEWIPGRLRWPIYDCDDCCKGGPADRNDNPQPLPTVDRFHDFAPFFAACLCFRIDGPLPGSGGERRSASRLFLKSGGNLIRSAIWKTNVVSSNRFPVRFSRSFSGHRVRLYSRINRARARIQTKPLDGRDVRAIDLFLNASLPAVGGRASSRRKTISAILPHIN